MKAIARQMPPQCFRCQPTHSTNTSTRHACTSCRWWRSSAKASPAPPSTPQTHVFNQQPGRHGLPAAALRPMGVVCGTHTLQCPSGQVSRRSCTARAHVPAVAAGRLPVRGGACSEDMPARAQAALRSMDRKRRHPQCLRHICAGCIRTDAKQAPARPAACRPAGRLRGACWPVGAKLPPLSRLTQCSTSSLFAHVWFKHSCPAAKLAASGHAAPLRVPLWPHLARFRVPAGRLSARQPALGGRRRPLPVAPPCAPRAIFVIGRSLEAPRAVARPGAPPRPRRPPLKCVKTTKEG